MTTAKLEKNIFTLQPNPFQHEILELASKQRSNLKKEEVLKYYRNDGLTTILIWNFDPNVISDLPPGDVPYLDNESEDSPPPIGKNLSDLVNSKVKSEGVKSSGYYGTQDFLEENLKTSIRNEYKNFYIFCRGGAPHLKRIRKETMFINMLKGLHPSESELLILVKDKKLTDKYKITFENVKNAYSDIVWGVNRSVK
jgi:hypothetical protein